MSRPRILGLSMLVALAVSAPASAAEPPEVLRDLDSVVDVLLPDAAGYPAASKMRADCPLLVRYLTADGSATEWQVCQLNDEPVMVPEFQGVPPTTTITYGGGECVWLSDYFGNTSGADVHAATWEVTVTPAGRVFAISTYPAEPLACIEPSAAPGSAAP